MFQSVLASFLTVLILTPLVIHISKHFLWYDDVTPRKMHSRNVPRTGGIVILIASFVGTAVYMIFFSSVHCLPCVIVIAVSMLIIFCGGFLDDIYELRVICKLGFQIVSSLAVSLSPLYFKSFLGFEFYPPLGRFLTFFWTVSLINAFNMIDGLDLLCPGISFITHLCIGIFFVVIGQSGTLCFIFAGALLAFMFFNRPPAKIFLGDSGSHVIGFSIAIIPMICDFGQYEPVKLLIMFLVVSIPATDVLAAIWRRKREKRPFFSADRAHIHHKLINMGLSEGKAVLFLLIIQFFICLSVGMIFFMKSLTQKVVVLSANLLVVWGIFIAIHYLNRSVNIKFQGKLPEEPEETRF